MELNFYVSSIPLILFVNFFFYLQSVNVDWPPLIDSVQLDETNLLTHSEVNNIISNTEVKDFKSLNSGSATTS